MAKAKETRAAKAIGIGRRIVELLLPTGIAAYFLNRDPAFYIHYYQQHPETALSIAISAVVAGLLSWWCVSCFYRLGWAIIRYVIRARVRVAPRDGHDRQRRRNPVSVLDLCPHGRSFDLCEEVVCRIARDYREVETHEALARDAIIEIRGLLEKASLPTASLHALETALGALAKRKGATQRKARRAWAAVADVAFSRRRLEKERDQAIARAVVAENLLDRAGALLLDAEWNTHHSAENSYCRWCHNAKDAAGKERFDTWQDQTEHAPECPYAAWRACAGRIAGDGKARP